MRATKKEKAELIRWLIERNNDQRESIASRATIVVSADALFLGGATYLLSSALAIQKPAILQNILIICVCIVVLFLVSSIIFATMGMVNWKISKKELMHERQQRLFFRSHDTVTAFKNFTDYREAFNHTSQDQFINYSLNYLWTMQNLFRDRYQALLKAVLFLLLSIIPFVASIIVLLLSRI